jgi:hypothetical protein
MKTNNTLEKRKAIKKIKKNQIKTKPKQKQKQTNKQEKQTNGQQHTTQKTKDLATLRKTNML